MRERVARAILSGCPLRAQFTVKRRLFLRASLGKNRFKHTSRQLERGRVASIQDRKDALILCWAIPADGLPPPKQLIRGNSQGPRNREQGGDAWHQQAALDATIDLGNNIHRGRDLGLRHVQRRPRSSGCEPDRAAQLIVVAVTQGCVS